MLLGVAVIVAWAGAGLWGWRLAARAGLSSVLGRSAVAGGVAVSVFVVVTAEVARWFAHFDAGLIAAAAAGAALLWFYRSGDGSKASGPSLAFWGAAALMTLLQGYIAVRYQMHDEFHVSPGHRMAVEQLRHGLYPINLPAFPGVEPRYHYGFDVLAGALTRGFGLSADWALDLTTIALALLTSLAAGALAEAAQRELAAPLAAIAVHLGGGLAWLLLAGGDAHPRCLMQYDHASCGVIMVRPQLSYFHQHPVAIGLPLALVWLLLAWRLRKRWDAPLAVAAVLVLAALALGQILYFTLAGLAVLVTFGWLALRDRDGWADTLRLLGVLAAALVVAWTLGGMFQRPDIYEARLLVWRWPPGYPPQASLQTALRFLIANVGVGLLAVAAAPRSRAVGIVALAAIALGGMLAPQIVDYPWSADVKKFWSVAAVAGALLYAIQLDPMLAAHRWLRRAGRALLLGGGLLTAVYLVVPLPPPHTVYEPESVHRKVDPIVATVIRWLWGNGYARDQVVFAQKNIARSLAAYGGLSTVGFDLDLAGVGIRPERLRRLRSDYERARQTLDPTALKALGVRWIVLSDEELAHLGARARAALESKHGVRVVATFPSSRPLGRRRVWVVAP